MRRRRAHDVELLESRRLFTANPVSNPGFEAFAALGGSNPWPATSGFSISTSYPNNGTRSLAAGANNSTEWQTISGLSPYTSYVLTGYMYIVKFTGPSKAYPSLAVKDYGGAGAPVIGGVAVPAAGGEEYCSLVFTTGNVTTATIGAYSGWDFPGSAYFDDINVQPLADVQNLGFESGSTSLWTSTGTTGVVTSPVNSGSYAARVVSTPTAYAQLIQTVSGLAPNTTYQISVSAEEASGNAPAGAQFGVNDYGGSQVNTGTLDPSSSYKRMTLTFTTGSTNYSAQIFAYLAPATAGATAYFDDFSVTQLASTYNFGFESALSSPLQQITTPIVDGQYGARLNAAVNTSQYASFAVINGLVSGQQYTLTGYGRLAAGGSTEAADLEVANYGGSPLYSGTQSGSYTSLSITFTPTGTSATVFLDAIAGYNACTATFDELNLVMS